ncbi:MAG: RluA family pseudouridine synthase [Eubacterium sp.]|nr:RluA family pseudouridine synthase [Eubacterium sp.]
MENKEVSEIRQFLISRGDDNLRLDIFLTEQTEYSRSYIQKLIKQERICIDDQAVKKSGVPVEAGQTVTVSLPPVSEPETVEPEKMDLTIVYEDEDVILIDKPKGMVVHPAAGHPSHTLVNGLLYHCQGQLSGINGILRPGIVHRIDRDTTGILIACKNDKAHHCLAEQFAEHSITRRYQAVVYNNFKEDDGTVDQAIARDARDRKKMSVVPADKGRHAVTHYHVLDHLNHQFNHIECRLETGRTHQIRVHMSYIHHPLLGDTVYGPKPDSAFAGLEGQVLHAGILGFVHPSTHQYMEFTSELPPYFVDVLNRLKKT